MPTIVEANFFPKHWIYGEYDQAIHHSIQQQIDQQFPNQQNFFFSTTWRPDPDHDTELQKYLHDGTQFDNLFVTATVDWAWFQYQTFIKEFAERTGVKNIYYLGNFDNPKPAHAPDNSTTIYFNFFAVVCRDHFEKYNTEDLILTDPKYLFMSYNRKPYEHRLRFVKKLIEHNVKDLGVVTLGRQWDNPYDGNPVESDLYFSIGEKNEDYVKHGHWYDDGGSEHGIPHDLFSLHNMHYWKHHFLHIVGGTCQWNNADQFINQIDFKPIIGLRPFLINGQTKNYNFWKTNGFRTFDNYFPVTDPWFLHGNTDSVQLELIKVIKYLSAMRHEEILAMYNDMLPDLLYNRQRWYEWADEQKYQVEHLFQ